MNLRIACLALFGVVVLGSGCAIYDRHSVSPQQAQHLATECGLRKPRLSPELEAQVLALNPEHVTDQDVRNVLAYTPAPRIINIHGGIFPVHTRMISFSMFLVGMGYPEVSITNPADGTYTFSCYESCEKIAGVIAWHYEKEGLRPLMVGHSQGGMQAVKVLHKLAGRSAKRLSVWNPLTWQKEDRYDIIDPLTGQRRPVVGLQLPYVTAVGAGGLARVLPNQWDTCGKLRTIPDSAEEFTGFYKGRDLLGGDFLGYGSANHFKANGKAVVRNVQLPSVYKHGDVPNTQHLLHNQAIKDWINEFKPPNVPFYTARLETEFDADSRHILWAAEVWYSIKKHWVLELQRYLRAQRLGAHAG